MTWFNLEFEKSEKEDDFVSMKNLYEIFKGTEGWRLMTKASRRIMTLNKFKDKLKCEFGDSYRERINYYDEDHILHKVRSVLIKFKVVVQDDD